MDFVARVHNVSQKLIPQHGNSGYPPMIVAYCRFPPILLDQDGNPDGPTREGLDKAIFSVMEGRAWARGKSIAAEAFETLRGQGRNGIILGCPEIPFLLPGEEEEPDLINPSALLAQAAVAYALK